MLKFVLVFILSVTATDIPASCRSQSVKHKLDVLNGYPKEFKTETNGF
jgi:hypothetical protein